MMYTITEFALEITCVLSGPSWINVHKHIFHEQFNESDTMISNKVVSHFKFKDNHSCSGHTNTQIYHG